MAYQIAMREKAGRIWNNDSRHNISTKKVSSSWQIFKWFIIFHDYIFICDYNLTACYRHQSLFFLLICLFLFTLALKAYFITNILHCQCWYHAEGSRMQSWIFLHKSIFWYVITYFTTWQDIGFLYFLVKTINIISWKWRFCNLVLSAWYLQYAFQI